MADKRRYVLTRIFGAPALAGASMILAAVVASAAVVGPAAAQDAAAGAIVGDPAAGKEKAYTCLGCHGVKRYVNVYPSYHVPYIAGQNEVYLQDALKAYRARERSHQTMQANASLLTDQDIADLAAWFSAQGTADQGNADQGTPNP